MARLRQQLERLGLGDVAAQRVAGFLAKFAIDGAGQVLARLHKPCGQPDNPTVERVAELADEHELPVVSLRHDGNRVGCPARTGARLRRRGRGMPEIGSTGIDGLDNGRAARFQDLKFGPVGGKLLARGALVLERRPVGQGVRQDVLVDPALGYLLDAGKTRRCTHGNPFRSTAPMVAERDGRLHRCLHLRPKSVAKRGIRAIPDSAEGATPTRCGKVRLAEQKPKGRESEKKKRGRYWEGCAPAGCGAWMGRRPRSHRAGGNPARSLVPGVGGNSAPRQDRGWEGRDP